MNSTDTIIITNDLISFLNSESWNNFKQILPETGKNIKNNLIDVLYYNINSGQLTIENVFQKYNCNELVESFILSPNLDFLHLCFNLYPKSNFIQPFLESIFINSPEIIMNCLENALFSGNYDILQKISHISVFLLNYNITSSLKFREILFKIPIEITLKEIFSFLSTFNADKQEEYKSCSFNFEEFSILLQNLYSKSENSFWSIIKTVVMKEDPFSIELLSKSFKGTKEFQLFANSIPQSNVHHSNNKDFTSSISDLISFYERTNKVHQSLIDLFNSDDKETFNYLIKSIEFSTDFSQPLKFSFLNKLRSMKMIPKPIEIEKLDLNMNLNDKKVTIDQIIKYIERSKVGVEQFASKLFNVFHLSYVEQDEQTLKSFVDQFYLKYLNRLQFQTIDKLAEIAIEFLKSDLIYQHRLSLSALAIRLPISKYINKLFFNEFEFKSTKSKSGTNLLNLIQKCISKEITIIESLHIAAIQTCSYLKLSLQSFVSSQKARKSRNCSLNIISSDVNYSNSNQGSLNDECKLSFSNDSSKQTVASIDRKLILRLRWRTLRNDTSNAYSFLPEFMQLCESDERMFVKWEAECSHPTGMKRSQILSKLGILNNQGIIPSLLYEILRFDSKVDDSFIELVNPVFSSNVDLKAVKIPENPNLSILFRFNFLWCTAVMCHPKICKVLRNPTDEISLALLRSLLSSSIIRDFHNNNEFVIHDFSQTDEKNTKYFDQLFTTFPLAFSAILSNSSSLTLANSNGRSNYFTQDLTFISKFKKPSQIIQAEQILNGFKKPLKNMPRYMIVSVSFEFAKRKNLIHLADISNGDQLWTFFCFFFSITFSMFDVSVILLKKFDFLFNYLHKGVNEENLFVGHKKWTNGLIQFSSYCSENDISFDDRNEWIVFNDLANALKSESEVNINRSKSDEWQFQGPNNESASTSPLSSQSASSHETNFSNPQ